METHQSEINFNQNCLLSAINIKQALSIGALGGKDISADPVPNDIVGCWCLLCTCLAKLASRIFSVQSADAGQQNILSSDILGNEAGRLSDELLHDLGRLVAKLPNDEDSSAPKRVIDGHRFIAIWELSGLQKINWN